MKLFKNMKDSELGQIPSDWEIGKVKDYFTLGRGRVISKPYIRENSGSFPVFSSQSFNNGEMGRIDTYDFDGSYLTWTTDGAYAGSVFFREGKFNCTNVCGTCLAKDPSVVNTKYAAYYLETQAKKYVSYVGNPKLMNNIFAEIPIVLPPLPEQNKIAEILSGFDRLINLKVQKLNKSKIFSFPLVDKLLSSNDLEFVSLSDIAEIVRGKFSHRPRNDPDFYGGNYPFIQTGDVPKDELFIGSHSQTLNERGLSVSRLFPEGTLTMTIAATIAEVGILKYPACFPDSIVGITPKLNKCNVVYLFYIIKKLKEELKSLAPQSAQSNLNLEILNAFKIPLPSLDVQHKISKLIKCSLENIELQKKDIHKLKVIKNGLSHDLLSGRKRMTT